MALSIKVLGTVLGLTSQVQNRPYLLLLIKAARFLLYSSVCYFWHRPTVHGERLIISNLKEHFTFISKTDEKVNKRTPINLSILHPIG